LRTAHGGGLRDLAGIGGGDLRQLLPELEDGQFLFENLLDVLRLYLRHSIVAFGSENRLRDEPFDDGVAEKIRLTFSNADISVFFQWCCPECTAV